MTELASSLSIIFTETYYWITVVMMFLIHVGFATYEVGTARPKNALRTVLKNIMVIPVVTITFFLFGWWIYFALPNGLFIFNWNSAELTGFFDHNNYLPWSPIMGTNLADRFNGVFWAAFLLFSWTAASIVSGAALERIRTGAFLLIAVLIGSVTWITDAAWGWHPLGWMTQLLGYHDAYASGVIHAIAGGTALAVLIHLGPRIGKFGANGEIRDLRPHNIWMSAIGLLLIYTGFWGFYAACNVPIFDFGSAAGGEPYFTATNIYGMPTTLSAITFNFLLSLAGGMLAGYYVSKGDPYWTLSCGLAGIIAGSAGNDLYHPLQAFLVGGVIAFVIYKLHYYVERRFKIDDAVGAVAVHGYAGFLGVVVAGFLLWGYPNALLAPGSATPLFVTAEGNPAVNPIGNFIGAVIMFGVLGFAPAYVVAWALKKLDLLRVKPEMELAGLDTFTITGWAYPYFQPAETDFEHHEREAAKRIFGSSA